MSDQAKGSHARLVVLVFLGTTLALHVAYRTFSWQSLLFGLVGMFAVSLVVGVTFYLLEVTAGKVLARFATPGPRTDAIVINLSCLMFIIEIAATIAVTIYAFRAIVLSV